MPPKSSLPKPSPRPPRVGDAVGGYQPPGFRPQDAIRSYADPTASIRSQEAAYEQAWTAAAERDRHPRVPGRPTTSTASTSNTTLFASNTTATEKPATNNGMKKG